MRNAQEIISAATATGTFENYQGDGASVPWQVALPISLPAAFTMWSYKQYLDIRFPLAFKVHDWCYTPYGSLISVTREEADSAMRELIAQTSPVDAEIVYAAVRAFGDPYFGTSQTGYTGMQAQGTVSNIDVPPEEIALPGTKLFNLLSQTQENNMVATKAIIKFNGSTVPANPQASIGYTGTGHAFGFSESLIYNNFTIAQTKQWLTQFYGPRRAAILPLNVTITSATLYDLSTGQGIEWPIGMVGVQPSINHANDAILAETRNETAEVQRRWWIHCMPDGWVTEGELRVTGAQALLIADYLATVGAGSWIGVVRNDLSDVIEVSETGVVTLTVNQPFAVGQWLTITRTLNESKKRVGGKFMVESVGPLLTQFKLANWTAGYCLGGKIYRGSTGFFVIGAGSGAFIKRAGTRRVGRPFDAYRGRQSART